MTPLPVVPSVVKIQFSWTYGTDANVMTHMYFQIQPAGDPPVADFQAFVNLARSSWVTNMLGLQTNAVGLRTVYGTFLGDTSYPVLTSTGSNAGTRLGGILFANIAALVNLKISRRYRGGHPRLYIPAGAQTDMVDPQHWLTGFMTSFATGWNAWVAAMQGVSTGGLANATLCNVSYYHANALRATPVVDPVTSSALNPVPATQRRRLRP